MHILIFSESVMKKCSTKLLFCTSSQNLCKTTCKRDHFLAKLLAWTLIKSQTVLKRSFCTGIFQSFNHRWVIEQNQWFCRAYFNGYFSSSNLELQTEMELKLLPFSLTCLNTYWLTYFIRAPARTILSKFVGLKHHKCFSRSSLCYTILSYSILYHTILYLGWKVI